MSAARAGPAWSSSIAFYLVTVGAAVGLGSIWRFPYLAGTGGGSAFVFVFVLACLLIATPLLAAEFIIGRRAGRSPPEAAGAVAVEIGGSRRWNAIGVIGTVGSFLVMTYYLVIAAWVLAYAWKCASGALTGRSPAEVGALWESFLADPVEVALWHAGFVALVALISARGVNRGIELANRIRAPVLFMLLVVLAGYSLATGDVRRGLTFAFAPNFRAITPAVVLAAIGQAFFATGVGMAMMIAYGAYLKRGTSVVRSALIISGAIVVVSLLATVIVFPLVFRYGLDPAQGTDLVFRVLASVFAEIPAGRAIGALFFVMLVFAALTPSLAGIEPIVAWLEQRARWSRTAAVAGTAIALWSIGLLTVLSFNVLADWHPLHAIPGFENRTYFGAADYLTTNLMLPIGALLTSLLVGWRLPAAVMREELDETTPFARACVVLLLRFACPIAIVAVLIANL